MNVILIIIKKDIAYCNNDMKNINYRNINGDINKISLDTILTSTLEQYP